MPSERPVKDFFGLYTRFLERAMGIEPTSEAWEASILPLYDARSSNNVAKARSGRKGGVTKLLSAGTRAKGTAVRQPIRSR